MVKFYNTRVNRSSSVVQNSYGYMNHIFLKSSLLKYFKIFHAENSETKFDHVCTTYLHIFKTDMVHYVPSEFIINV